MLVTNMAGKKLFVIIFATNAYIVFIPYFLVNILIVNVEFCKIEAMQMSNLFVRHCKETNMEVSIFKDFHTRHLRSIN